MRARFLALFVALFMSIVLTGCFGGAPPKRPTSRPTPPIKPLRYERADWSALSGWSADNVQDAWPAFIASCRALRFRSEWTVPCTAAQGLPAPDANAVRSFFRQYFDPYQVMNSPGYGGSGPNTGLVTGYYEPLLYGSRTPTPRFTVPVYSTPPDLLIVDLASLYPELKGKRVRGRLDGNRVVPYYTRAELPTDAAIRGKEIVYIDGALDAFMLQVQGSGRVQLPDGETIRLQYADQNGHPFRSIGRYLVDRGEMTLDQASMPGIRAWLAANPARLNEVLNANPSVVFFTEAPLDDPNIGPKGAQGVPLTAGRSIAVDPAFVPLGSPVFLATTYPDSSAPLQRLVIAQDTGGAIAGPARADIFGGTGRLALEQAGKMRQPGLMWLLWPKNVPLPSN
jgi:membrane-bound lytic murein transglycosylase A